MPLLKAFATILIKPVAILLTMALSAAVVVLVALMFGYQIIGSELPDIEKLNETKLSVPMEVFSADGKLIASYGEQRRRPVTYEQLPPQMVQAFLAAEDDRFFEHPGVDWQGLARSVYGLATTGEKRQGGSTITMQLTRNLLLSNEKTYERKLKEILLSLRIEKQMSKEQILTLYLNKIFLGHRAYGVGAAADVYYGKTVDELTLAEIAMIASLPKSPSTVNPISNPKSAKQRRGYVLSRMQELGLITESEKITAADQPITAKKQPVLTDLDAGYVAEMIRADMITQFGEGVYESGIKVYASIDSRQQTAANEAVRYGLREYNLRHGYRGPEAKMQLPDDDGLAGSGSVPNWDDVLREYPDIADLRAGLVTEASYDSASVYLEGGQTVRLTPDAVRWARRYEDENKRGPAPGGVSEVLTPGDVVRVRNDRAAGWQLSQRPSTQAALAAIDPQTGAIRALVGGYSFFDSKFNRAVQSIRQPGSGFKPFLYSAALENGFNAASIINDAPVVFENIRMEKTWRPQNYSGRNYGPTRLREALVNSRNLVSIRILQAIGIDKTRNFVEKFGFDKDKLARDMSLSLGNAALTPLQMSVAFGVFANGGFKVDPYLVDRIEDHAGNTLFTVGDLVMCDNCPEKPPKPTTLKPDDIPAKQFEPKPRYAPRVISAQNAYIMTSILQDVASRGTGKKTRALGRNDIAGKTGTTNDQIDAWFNGFNSRLVATAWMGFDKAEPMGNKEFGSAAALPIWLEYMKVALAGVPDSTMAEPQGIVNARIDKETGLLANAGTANSTLEIFQANQLPERSQEVSQSIGTSAPTDENFDDLLF